MTLVSGPEEGRNGASALDLWRAQTGKPNATVDDMMAALKGKDGAGFLDQWRQANNQPTATMADVAAALKGTKGDSVKGDPGPAGIVPVYLAGKLQANVQLQLYDVTSDSTGNWTVDCSAAKFVSILDVNATAWKDTDTATDQVDTRYRIMSPAKVTGSVVKGAKITSLLITAGADTVSKASSVPVRVAILGTVAG